MVVVETESFSEQSEVEDLRQPCEETTEASSPATYTSYLTGFAPFLVVLR